MDNRKISKRLSFVLRHAPESIGITLDAQGWTSVDGLLKQLAAHGFQISEKRLHHVVKTDDKQRYTLSEDKTRIRAAQGHSVDIHLELPAIVPPDVLYHGTATRNLTSIREKGLIPGTRQHVHLSADTKTAKRVGARHGTPYVLEINAAAMHAEGLEFFQADNGVWLTSAIPARYITI
jgi:putative RNA 2'-phosphotransferase